MGFVNLKEKSEVLIHELASSSLYAENETNILRTTNRN